MTTSVPTKISRPPLYERLGVGISHALGSLHDFLARVLPRFFGWLWRTQGKVALKVRFAVGFLLLALASALCATILPLSVKGPSIPAGLARIASSWPSLFIRWNGWSADNPEFIRYLANAGKMAQGSALAVFAAFSALLALAAAIAALIRKRGSLGLLKAAWALHAAILLATLNWCAAAPKVLFAADSRSFDDFSCKEIWFKLIFSTPFLLIVPALVLVALLARQTRRYYHAGEGKIASDGFIASIRTGGRDPRFRSSLYWAVALFVLVIVMPFLIRSCGTEEYGIVKGQGEPQVEQVKIKPKPKKKQKKLVIDPWSPYILERINIDDAKVLEELQEQTMDTYQADRTTKGKLGKGGPGKGGWPKGMEGAKVRFIRLEYSGGNWDQEMGKSGDYNLLVRFSQLTGLPVASETEHRKIERLAHFAKKKAPPFVFITGSGNINITAAEAKIMRKYCEEEGGMLFIDCGGGNFGRSVRNMLAKVFPGKSLVDIPNDDPIYQAPFLFPNGAPRFWHHDGNRALAIRHEGRIVAFYHPGDVKDAWKEGHSGVSEEVADQAYKLGVNVIYYAFNQYYRRHYEQNDEE